MWLDKRKTGPCPRFHRSRTVFAAWRVKDSNLGRHQPTDLQSAPIGRSGNPPGNRMHRPLVTIHSP